MSDNEKIVLEALALLLNNPDLEEHIQFVTSNQQNTPIVISFRNKLLPGEEESFLDTIRGLSLDFPKIKNKLTDRLIANANIRKKSLGRSLASTRLIVTTISKADKINEDFTDLAAFKDKKIRNIEEQHLARLLEQVFITWNNLPASLRKPREINEKHIRGYVKLRDSYSHDEIIEALTTYGRWAEAYDKALANHEPKAFWFYTWSLDKFMISDKSMNNVDGGWRELVKSKMIPEEYAGVRKATEAVKNEDRKADWIDKYTDRIIAGEDVSDDAHIASEYEDEIKEALKRKNYVQ